MTPSPTILVVDDEPKIIEVVASYLERAGYQVVAASTGRQALEQIQRHTPLLVVLDLMLPDLSGEEVCRAIRRQSDTPVILLTARAEEESVLRGLSLGADDYVTKPFSPRQLVARVEAVLRRSAGGLSPDAPIIVCAGGDLTIDSARHEVRKAGMAVPLTPAEFSLLVTLARRPSRVFTRDELLTFALGGESEGYDRVIDTHIKNLRQKLENDPKNPRYLLTVYGAGYKFVGENP